MEVTTATSTSPLEAARERMDAISAELLQVTERINELRPKLAQAPEPKTPGEALDMLLGGGPQTYQAEFSSLSQRAALLSRGLELARAEHERLARERSVLLKAAAQPELLKLKRAACDALEALARAVGAIDDAHMDLARQGADLTSGYTLLREDMTASELKDLAQAYRRDLEREEWALSQGTSQRRRIRMLTAARVDGKPRQPGEVFDCTANVAALAVLDGWAETAAIPMRA